MKKLAFILLFLSTSVNATTSEFTNFYIPYQRVQSEYMCLDKQIMLATYGIPLASLVKGVLAPTKTLHQSFAVPNNYKNINQLAMNNTRILDNLISDNVTPAGVYEYSFSLDLVQLNTFNGNSLIGRQKTKNTAKLAVISIIKTAILIHGAGHFRVRIQFTNMPSQSGTTGSPLISQPPSTYPYVASSAVYNNYLNEMIHSSCQN
jgi:hypothetical protein